MRERYASFLVCDELLTGVSGKYFIQAVYTGDIVITAEQQQVSQLVFIFIIETPCTKPFKRLQLSVALPGEKEPIVVDMTSMLPPILQIEGRTTMTYRLPVPLAAPVLRPGAIELKVIHEDGEMLAGRQWISTIQQMQVLQAEAAKLIANPAVAAPTRRV